MVIPMKILVLIPTGWSYLLDFRLWRWKRMKKGDSDEYSISTDEIWWFCWMYRRFHQNSCTSATKLPRYMLAFKLSKTSLAVSASVKVCRLSIFAPCLKAAGLSTRHFETDGFLKRMRPVLWFLCLWLKAKRNNVLWTRDPASREETIGGHDVRSPNQRSSKKRKKCIN